MLPATKSHRFSLADVLLSCRDSLRSKDNTLSLPPVDKTVVLLVDGLGVAALKARAGHARTLVGMLSSATTIDSGFPTTTASALATLTTGLPAGQHGLVGYTVLDPAHDRIVNQLNGWDERLDPAIWQRSRTIFESATDAQFLRYAVGPVRFRDSGFTAAVLRGAEYHSAVSIADRLAEARALMDASDRALIYVYVPELDIAAHATGSESTLWTEQLETLDSAVRDFIPSLTRREGLLVTADHGVLDVPHRSHVLIDSTPALIDGIRFVAGDPRCIQLHFEPDATSKHRATVVQRWRESEEARAWVVTREEAIAAGWFGPEVDQQVLPRIGDVLVAARKSIAYYDSRTSTRHAQAMVGQHGSWSPEETRIPLIRFGAYAMS
jgi:predicted AlkP superfamily pyrophosphatase or phosphodiesterase